jgi:2-keto-3-deoxy-6-phosphogluconate aldolase
MTVPGALEVIAGLTRRHPSTVVGAGPVLDLATARASVLTPVIATPNQGKHKMVMST